MVREEGFQRPINQQPRKRMMAQGRKTHFMYDLRGFLATTKLDPAQHRAFGETLFAKGARTSTEEAKAWLFEKRKEDIFTQNEFQILCQLVERYSFWR